jgi:hypothetical protein
MKRQIVNGSFVSEGWEQQAATVTPSACPCFSKHNIEWGASTIYTDSLVHLEHLHGI